MSDHMTELEQKFKNRNLLEELAYYANYPPKGYVRKEEVDLIQWAMYKAYQIIKGRPAMSSCDYISREDAKNAAALIALTSAKREMTCGEVKRIMEDIPPAEVRPVIPAQWIALDIYRSEGNYKCSNCGQPCYVPECMGEPMYSVCPNCGADMRDAR